MSPSELEAELPPEIEPLPSKRSGLSRRLFALGYVVMGGFTVPIAQGHYGRAATFKWVAMSVLWPIEALLWLGHIVSATVALFRTPWL
jgi:hypothetical protein